jgi:hypothetical protein
MASKFVAGLRLAMMIVAAAGLALALLAVVDFALSSSQYRFGTEVGSWRYGSATRYTAALFAEAAFASLSLLFFARSNVRMTWLIGQAMLLSAYLCVAALL